LAGVGVGIGEWARARAGKGRCGAWGGAGCTRHASMSVPSISQPARAHSSGETAVGLQNHACALLNVASRSCRSATECGRQVTDVPKAASGSIIASRSLSEWTLGAAASAGAASALPPIANGEPAAVLKRLPWLMLKGEMGEAAAREDRVPGSGVAAEGGWWLMLASSALSRLSRIVLTRFEAGISRAAAAAACRASARLVGGGGREGTNSGPHIPNSHVQSDEVICNLPSHITVHPVSTRTPSHHGHMRIWTLSSQW